VTGYGTAFDEFFSEDAKDYQKEYEDLSPGIIWVPKVSSSYRFLLRTGKKL
jgi:hypothetical protein